MTRSVTMHAGNQPLGEQTAPAWVATATASPYGSPLEHILDRLQRLDLLMRREIARHHQPRSTEYLSFAAITSDEVDALLHREPEGEESSGSGDVERLRAALAGLERHTGQRVE